MFSSDKNIERIVRLIIGLRKYGELRLEKMQLEAVSKVTAILSMIIVGMIFSFVAVWVVLLLSLAFVLLLEPYTKSYVTAILLVAGLHLFFASFAFAFRRRLIIDPIANILSSVLLNEQQEKDLSETTTEG